MSEPTITTTALPPVELKPHPSNIRERFDGNEMKRLIDSVKAHGILEPLLVRPIWQLTVGSNDDQGWEVDHHQVVAGHRRLRAAESAGLDQVPVVVREMDDVEALQAMLVENLQRADLTPVEEARGYLRLSTTGMTVKELAANIGRSQKHVSGRIKLLEQPGWLLKLLHEGETTLADVETFAELWADIGVDKLTEEEQANILEVASRSYASHGPRAAARDAAGEVQAIRRDRVVAEVRSKASAKGLEVVEQERSDGYSWKFPAGHAKLADLNVNVKAHRKETCHAIGLENDRSGFPVAVEICTRRSRHTKSGPSEVKPADLDAQVAAREKAKEEREHAKAREQQLREQIGKAVIAAKAPALDQLIVTLALQRGFDTHTKERAETALAVNEGGLREAAEESAAAARRVLAALLLAEQPLYNGSPGAMFLAEYAPVPDNG